MNSQKPHTFILSLILLGVLVSSCSTKKKTWFHKQYHNTTAKYNGYFNSKESVKKGVKKLHESHKDDYTKILPLYKIGDLESSKIAQNYMDKAIKKSSIVIQRHSINIRGKEYCKWIDENYLLVGIGYFYKGEFNEAIKTFQFVKNEYKKTKTSHQASLWLIRSFTEKKDFISGEIEITEIKNNRKFPQKLKTELSLVVANYYLKQNNLPLALDQIQQAINTVRKKETKVRLYYISGQIYQQNNNFSRARKHYETVIRLNPEYEMVFNAKMNLARSLESGSKDVKKIRQKLVKMIKDDKNKDYLDQIYYTLAELDINNKDTISAIDNYLLSTINSVQNNSQKAMSFLSLAEIEYSRSKYRESKTHYDSTVFYMKEDFRLYDQAKEKHEILVDLIRCLDVVYMQDSLQMLAKLPPTELKKVINEIIQDEIEKEREELENERIRQQMMYENNRNGGRGEQFGNNTSGGKWYFYNPATLSFGLSEFRKKWGKRKLEDDWRRKDKKSTTVFENDSNLTNPTTSTNTENKRSPEYYLEKLPKTKEDFETSDSQIKEALYQAGIIYKENLREYQKSTSMFNEIISRFSTDKQYSPLAYYKIYLNQTKQKKLTEAENTKTLLLTHHPKSIYAKLITTPEHQKELLEKENEEEKKYQAIYQAYLERNYNSVIDSTETLQKNAYKTKYMFLRALSFAELKDTIKLKKELQAIITRASKEEIGKQAQYLLSSINDPSNMNKANELAVSGYDYLFKSNTPHMSIIIIPKQGVDINYLKTLISDFHSLVFENEVFEISAMLMGLDRHILMIKTFDNSSAAIAYNQTLTENKEINKELNKSSFRIMAISVENFKEFYKNTDMKGYYEFFTTNYLINNQ